MKNGAIYIYQKYGICPNPKENLQKVRSNANKFTERQEYDVILTSNNHMLNFSSYFRKEVSEIYLYAEFCQNQSRNIQKRKR